MPPKAAEKQKKAVDKAKSASKQKAAEDKTFGLKNKNKSAKVAQYVKNVTAGASVSSKEKRLVEQANEAKKAKKLADEQAKKEMAELFAITVKQPKVPPGVDPKSIVCEFFRHGQCTKSFKCKFSHDLEVERKTQKIDLFSDRREAGEGGDDDEDGGMEDWDQETLERVVREKAEREGGDTSSNANTATAIICRFFLDAVERRQYGWFWRCPNGKECKYRHALPTGYVLKSQMKELLEQEAAERKGHDVTEDIERARAAVTARTPLTEATFSSWHNKRLEKRRAEREVVEAERRKKGVLNGREIFLQEGFIATDDAGASGADDFAREDDEERLIAEMFERAEARRRAAAAAEGAAAEGAAAAAVGEGGAGAAGGGAAAAAAGGAAAAAAAAAWPSSSAAPAPIAEEEEEGAPGDDDAADDDDDDDDEDDDDDSDDMDDEALAALEAKLQASKV